MSYVDFNGGKNVRESVTDEKGSFTDLFGEAIYSNAVSAKAQLITPAGTLLNISSKLIQTEIINNFCLLTESNADYLVTEAGDYFNYEV